jgi:hypothetical protein
MKLDGTEVLKPVPFDAHEQLVRNPHTYSREEGYTSAPATAEEYPKAVAHDPDTGEPTIALNADHEDEIADAKPVAPKKATGAAAAAAAAANAAKK